MTRWRLAEAVDADEMRALGLAGDGARAGGRPRLGRLVAEHGQRERRLGDEHVARHDFEGRAGRIGCALVVAGDDGALAVPVEHDLRRAEDVPGRRQANRHAVDVARCAQRLRLEGARALRPHAHLHDLDGLGRRQHGAVPGARVVAMAVRDDGAIDGARRIDDRSRRARSRARGRSDRAICRRRQRPCTPLKGMRLMWGGPAKFARRSGLSGALPHTSTEAGT